MIDRLGIYYWKVRSRIVYPLRFGSFGRGSWMRHPMALINARQIHIGKECFIRDGARLEVVNREGLAPGSLTIGDRVNFEQNVHIVACDRVLIDDDVCFAPRCTVVDTTHPSGTPEEGNRATLIDPSPSFVHIKRRAFLGTNVVVLPNVTIGENAIIGANSVVTSDVPDNCVAVGAPAKVIRVLA